MNPENSSKETSRSTLLYIAIALVTSILCALGAVVPQSNIPHLITITPRPAAPVYALYNLLAPLALLGITGLIGMRLSRLLKYPELLDDRVSSKKRFLVPAVIGLVISLIPHLIWIVMGKGYPFFGLTIQFVSYVVFGGLVIAVIGQTLVTLFLLTVLVVLISKLFLVKWTEAEVFWTIAGLVSIGGPLILLRSLGMSADSVIAIAPHCPMYLLGAYYFRTCGFLATLTLWFANSVGGGFWSALIS